MNLSLNKLIIKSFLNIPYLNFKYNYNLNNFNFNYFFNNLIISKKNINIFQSKFFNFLSTVIINNFNFNYTIFSSFNNQNININNSIFYSIRSQNSNGGALYLYNCNLIVNKCLFDYCHSTSRAGAFYQNGYNLTLIFTCFFRCSSIEINQQGCNAFFCSNSFREIHFNSAYLCNPFINQGADSLYDVEGNILHLTNWNSTECYGRMGSSGGCFRSLLSNSFNNYTNIFN